MREPASKSGKILSIALNSAQSNAHAHAHVGEQTDNPLPAMEYHACTERGQQSENDQSYCVTK